MNMSVMDGLPETTLNNAVREHIEQVTEILEGMPSSPAEEPTGEPEVQLEEKVIILEEVERLKAENFSLRIQTLAFQREKFIQQANLKVGEYDQQIMEIRAAIGSFQRELDTKYGIDFSKHAIEPGTGRVIPAPQG
jgi:hypothetical protein